MPRLQSAADPTLWVPITESFGPRGRRHRKRAIRMLMSQFGAPLGMEGRRGGFAAWAMSQAAPAIMRRSAGRMLAWVWREEPELVVVMANLQDATPQARTIRAMRPIEYDDTETFLHPTLGSGERLIMDAPGAAKPPTANYSFDLGTHFVEITAVGGDPARFRTVIPALDDLARSVRLVDDLAGGETPGVLRLPPA